VYLIWLFPRFYVPSLSYLKLLSFFKLINECDCGQTTTIYANESFIRKKKNIRNEGNHIHKQLLIFSDGGARGNPGPAAAAFMVLSENNQVLKAGASYIGLRTNNQAEYEALIAALQFALTTGAEEVICHLDSELVARQLTGEYRVKNSELRKLWQKVQELRLRFGKVSFVNVPRTHPHIQRVDALVNEVLDEKTGSA
jgi:ribonuclease HI